MVNVQVIECPGFTISTPPNWRLITRAGEPDTMYIVIDKQDKVTINLGDTMKDIERYRALIIQDVQFTQTVDEEGGGRIIEETTSEFSRTVESDVFPDVIDACHAELLIPRQPGQGATGVFMKGPCVKSHLQLPFSIIGFSLAPENEKAFLAAIRTIRFKPAH